MGWNGSGTVYRHSDSAQEVFMKHLKYRIISAVSGSVCFFLAALSGSFLASADTQTDNPLSPGIPTMAPSSENDTVSAAPTTMPTDTSSKYTLAEAILNATQPAPELTKAPDIWSPTPGLTVTPDPSLTLVLGLSPTPGPTLAPSLTPTPVPSPTPTPSPTPVPSPTPTPSPTPEPFVFTKAIANVTEYVNIREGASTNTPVLGRLFKDGIAEILGIEGEWVYISSGNVTGYIFAEYLHLGEQALAYADKITAYNVKVTANSLNIRSGPGTEYDKLGSTAYGATYPALLSLSNKEWIAIQYTADTVAYVYADYVALVCNQKVAMTLAEIATAERTAKIEKTHVKSIPVTYRDPISITDEDLRVFALVVAAEAYWEPYDGKLAVANVILNRLISGKYGDTVYDVVTAPGQFSGYNHIDKFTGYDLSDCYAACREALSGKNNIGDYVFFHADYYVNSHDEWLLFSSWHQIEGHIFFKRTW